MSDQPHYDWGLRAIKAVLNSGGTILKELNAQELTKNEKEDRKSIESRAIIGAIIDAVVPKLI